MVEIIQCISAFFACIGFAFIFRIHHHLRFAFIASFGGALGWGVYLLSKNYTEDILAYFIAMTVVALFSEIIARICKAPATVFLIIGCFPLVPGRGIYETMLYCIQGNSELFLDSFLNTIGISTSLALAILIVSTIFKVIKKLSQKAS